MSRLLLGPAFLGLVAVAVGCGTAFGETTAAITVVGIGDSLLSGYGVASASNFSTVLEQRLIEAGYDADVFETGLQYTSKSGAYFVEHPYSRIEGREVDLSAPYTVAIVEVGGNDCVAGIPLAETRANLEKILNKLQDQNIPVLLASAAAFESCGADYAAAFERLFSELAGTFDVMLYPEFRSGLLGRPEFFQPDLDHPNEAGVAVIVENILPIVEQLIAQLDDR